MAAIPMKDKFISEGKLIIQHQSYSDVELSWDRDVCVSIKQRRDLISFDKTNIPEIIKCLQNIYDKR